MGTPGTCFRSKPRCSRRPSKLKPTDDPASPFQRSLALRTHSTSPGLHGSQTPEAGCHGLGRRPNHDLSHPEPTWLAFAQTTAPTTQPRHPPQARPKIEEEGAAVVSVPRTRGICPPNSELPELRNSRPPPSGGGKGEGAASSPRFPRYPRRNAVSPRVSKRPCPRPYLRVSCLPADGSTPIARGNCPLPAVCRPLRIYDMVYENRSRY